MSALSRKITAGAVRMRQLRDRERRSEALVTIKVTAKFLSELEAAGFLNGNAYDKESIAHAIEEFHEISVTRHLIPRKGVL